MILEKLGFDTTFKNNFAVYTEKGFHPARIIKQHKGQYVIRMELGDYSAKLSGKFRYQADIKKDYPAVGDWVAVKMVNEKEALIGAVLPRKSYFSRKLAISGGRKMKNGILVGGNIEEQIIGSNIDIAFIVSGLDDNFNIGRMERFITLALSSGAQPVILLNKCDLCDNPTDYTEKIKSITNGIAVHFISVLNQVNLEVLNHYLCDGKTVVFLGSSGVGKSTIINYLFGGEILKTNQVSSANGKGRHTTTGAELIQHRSGCSIIDTPGIRELQLWADEAILSESFYDVHELLSQCLFSDCSHSHEKGCAIQEALKDGLLSAERYKSFRSQFAELSSLQEKRKEYEGRRLKKLNRL